MMEQNMYTRAREAWENRQKELHGCNYVNGRCTVHTKGPLRTIEQADRPKPVKAQRESQAGHLFLRRLGN